MSKQKVIGQYAVGPVVHPDTGDNHMFMPGEVPPAWAVKLIDNPYAYEGGEAEAEPLESGTLTAPPQAGRGSSTDAWFDYAFTYGVPVDHDMSREDIIEACRKAGINVDG